MQYCAQAIDKNTGYFGSCTWADRELAYKTAKYYRSIGHRARVFAADEYDAAAEENYKMRCEQIRERLAGISAKVDRVCHEIKQGNASEGDCGGLLGVLLTREDILEWVLEEE